MLSLTNEGDWVFDPFLGTGTSIVAAIRHGRRGAGSEIHPGFVPFCLNHCAAYPLFTRPLSLYVCDLIDVGIEILPTKSLQSQMSSGVPYYEGEIYNVIRQGGGVPAVPLGIEA